MKSIFLTMLVAVAALFSLSTAPAQAEFGLKDLTVAFEEEDGSPATTAGSHPFAMSTHFGVNAEIVPEGAVDPETNEPVDGEVPEEELKDLTVAQAPGLIGSQLAVPQCSRPQFATRSKAYPSCPDETAVGYVGVKGEFGVAPVGVEEAFYAPLFNLDPSPGSAATFGFMVGGVPIAFDVLVSESPPYNLEVRLPDTPQALLVYGSEVVIWGNPAAEAHDDLRGVCMGEAAFPSPEPVSKGSCPVAGPEAPLLTLPRSCNGPLSTLFAATSWQGSFAEGNATTPGMQECGTLTFTATTEADPTTERASSPAGLDFRIGVEDEGLTDSAKRAQADIASVVTTLPEGFTANPSAASGQGACSEAQFEAASVEERGCPEDSKIGSAEVSSPLLEDPLRGSLYLAQPHQNLFGSLLATYLIIRSPRFGIVVKQAGRIDPDPRTGQLTATFSDIPELPFSDLSVHFREGPRALLATPAACGTYATEVVLTPSSGNAPLHSSSSFPTTAGPGGSPCANGTPFAPGFSAGSTDNRAGAYSPFEMRFTRGDGEGQISRLDAVLPAGVVGKIAGLGRCSDAQIAHARGNAGKAELSSPSCPGDSEIGHILAGAGVGPALTQVSGKLYLAGPYGGDPLSVVSVVPAVAGPFDLGTVVVREALDLDPETAKVKLDGSSSDPIPTILEGIPLQVRNLEIFVDRPNFTLNPTSCDEEQAQATLFAGPLSALLSQRYQASGCAGLGFKPKLSLKLKGGTRRSQHPALRSLLIPRPGDANIARAVVTLPPSEQIDNAHINNPCTRVQFAANACPPNSVLGTARAYTPLLDQPLEGPVYFRSNGGERQLPDVVADLHGQFHIVLVGFVDAKKARIRTTFASVPDAPVSRFELDLFGGKRGLLVNNRDLCRRKLHLKLALSGQNGLVRDTTPAVGTSCGRKAKHPRSSHR